MAFGNFNMIRVLFLSAILLLVGCASTAQKQQSAWIQVDKKTSASGWPITPFQEYFDEWKSVNYKYGGLSKKGVDCSGFVFLTFLDQFGVKLPRNTKLLVKLGKAVPKNKLKTGDLVFFKTSRTVRHVGIYLSDNKFIHASTSKGVITSSLNNRYWSQKFWKAKRLNPEY